MAVLDDELLEDAAIDAEVVCFVRQNLPDDVSERLSDEDLYYFHDLIEEYLADSSTLDIEPDEDGYVTIEVDAIVAYIIGKATAEKQGNFNEEDVAMVVEAELSYGDIFEDEDH